VCSVILASSIDDIDDDDDDDDNGDGNDDDDDSDLCCTCWLCYNQLPHQHIPYISIAYIISYILYLSSHNYTLK